jgi:hypothetical protein
MDETVTIPNAYYHDVDRVRLQQVEQFLQHCHIECPDMATLSWQETPSQGGSIATVATFWNFCNPHVTRKSLRHYLWSAPRRRCRMSTTSSSSLGQINALLASSRWYLTTTYIMSIDGNIGVDVRHDLSKTLLLKGRAKYIIYIMMTTTVVSVFVGHKLLVHNPNLEDSPHLRCRTCAIRISIYLWNAVYYLVPAHQSIFRQQYTLPSWNPR